MSQIDSKLSNNDDNEKRHAIDDDLVTLYGCGYITQWRFPMHLKECPVRGCRLQFKNRQNTIAHYKKVHAKNAILCSLCNKPIAAKQASLFIKHYRRMHPKSSVPFDFGRITHQTTDVSQLSNRKLIFN